MARKGFLRSQPIQIQQERKLALLLHPWQQQEEGLEGKRALSSISTMGAGAEEEGTGERTADDSASTTISSTISTEEEADTSATCSLAALSDDDDDKA